MPRLDRTGPMGQGVMTGKKQGKCSKKSENPDSSVQENVAPERRGMGRGAGQGLGLRQGLGKGLGLKQGRNVGKQ